MRLRDGLLVTTIPVLALALLCPSVEAWSNGGYSDDPDNPNLGTHDWIADKALSLQTLDVSHFETTYHDSFLIGTEAPDNPAYICDYTKHHTYFYSNGLLQDDAAAKRAEAMYESALARITDGEFDAAAYYMGAMVHYISDLGVFGHTMGDGTDWGAEYHHADYEDRIEKMLPSLVLPSSVTLGNDDAYDAALDLARIITFGSGTIKPNIWMDMNYDWSNQTFEASAMASLHQAVYASASAINHLLIATAPPPVELEPPRPPASLEALVQEGTVLLTWSSPTDDGGSPIIEYTIFRGVDLGDPQPLATVTSLTHSYRDLSADDGITYYYWVVARNSVGSSDMSEVASVTILPHNDSHSLFLPAVLSAVFAALISAGAVLWRKRNRAGPSP